MKKITRGTYQITHYRAWAINFPYMSERYLVFGTKAEAESEAKRIMKRNKSPHKYGLTEIKLH